MSKFLTIAALKEKMTDKPKAQRLYDFFGPDPFAITDKQINEAEKIIDKDYAARKKHISKAREKRRKDQNPERSAATGAK